MILGGSFWHWYIAVASLVSELTHSLKKSASVGGSEHRGTGQGRRLVEELSAKACSAGAWAVKLYSTRSAVGFYKRLGFQVIGPNQLMEKRLV
mmetsp:Transcript_81645/g.134941  ORF Transcript_81645/g.134941 Transcript_81645/m.134941 type:complete len:93 (+) Transcript_81645:725-1003(+)